MNATTFALVLSFWYVDNPAMSPDRVEILDRGLTYEDCLSREEDLEWTPSTHTLEALGKPVMESSLSCFPESVSDY